MPEIEILPDAASLAQAATQHFVRLAVEAISARGCFLVVLSGGSTPRMLYTQLALPPFAQKVDWSRVHFFWGDERCVPPDDADSNFRMANEALLQPLGISLSNIHRMPIENTPSLSAAHYERLLRQFFHPASIPRFDLVLLGLGEDGHTASLFPGTEALSEAERWVIDVLHTTPPLPLVTRLTLTLPVFNAAAHVIFLVSGKNKAGVLANVLRETQSERPLPAQMIHPTNGSLLWLVDREAMKRF